MSFRAIALIAGALLAAGIVAGEASAAMPTAITGSVSAVGGTSATLNGSVNPGGTATDWWFEYGTSASYGSKSATTAAGSGSANVAVSSTPTGLAPGTTYHYRLVAKNSFGTANGGDGLFTTASLPVVVTAAATGVGPTTATLGGSVNPNGQPTTWYVEYGLSTAYGTKSPAAEWSLFKVRSFAASTAYILLTNLTMYTTLLMIPFFVRDVLGKSTEEAGLLLGAMSVLVAVTAPFGGRLSDATGRRWPAQIGSVLMLIAAIALLGGLSPTVSAGYLAACLALLGLGLGLGVGAANTAAVESAPRTLAGSAAGTSSMMRYAGSIIGAGILAGVLNDHSGVGGDVTTFRLVTLAVITTAALAVIASIFIHRFVATEAIRVRAEPMVGVG